MQIDGGPVLTGNSFDVYWRDANNNGIFDPSDGRFFGGAPNLANFYMAINAVPEPGSVALMFAGGCSVLGLALRRRRK